MEIVNPCKEGKVINALTNRCVKPCKAEQERNPLTNRCIKIKNLPENITLAQRDLIIYQLEKQIIEKKKFLIRKTNELKKKEEANEFLLGIKNDYNNYYNYIVKEKEQQLEAMNILNTYLEDLIKTNNIVNNKLQIAKLDQKQILEEMEIIKQELDSLIVK
jgi:hypothetical protein